MRMGTLNTYYFLVLNSLIELLLLKHVCICFVFISFYKSRN